MGRVIGVLGTFYSCRLCFKKKTIKFNELLFITYAGMIRGAIAFALVLKIQYQGEEGYPDCPECYSKKNYDLVVSTTLMLVVLTTLIFGTFMDCVQKFLVPPKPVARGTISDNAAAHSMLGYTDVKRAGSAVTASEYEEIKHPNEEMDAVSDTISRRPSYLLGMGPQPSSWVNSGFVKWFVRVDEETLRPWLIRKYNLAEIEK